MIRFQGPFDAAMSPDGTKAAYGYIESGLYQDPTTGDIPAQTKNGAGFTSSTQLTGFTDQGYKHSNDWDAPRWVDNSSVIVSNGPSDPYDDPIASITGEQITIGATPAARRAPAGARPAAPDDRS